MEIFYAFWFAVVLSIDSFSAAFAMGFREHRPRDALRFGLSSGLSEGILAAAGCLFGTYIIANFSTIDHWIAFGLLAAVGSRMVFEAVKKLRSRETESKPPEQFHSLTRVIVVSVATSIDALGVGMGLGVAGKPWLLYSAMIAVCAFASTLIGLRMAKVLSSRFGPICELFGGLVLIGLAFPMLRI